MPAIDPVNEPADEPMSDAAPSAAESSRASQLSSASSLDMSLSSKSNVPAAPSEKVPQRKSLLGSLRLSAAPIVREYTPSVSNSAERTDSASESASAVTHATGADKEDKGKAQLISGPTSEAAPLPAYIAGIVAARSPGGVGSSANPGKSASNRMSRGSLAMLMAGSLFFIGIFSWLIYGVGESRRDMVDPFAAGGMFAAPTEVNGIPVVTMTLVAEGTLHDFDPASFKQSLAGGLEGVDPSQILLKVQEGSLIILVTILTPIPAVHQRVAVRLTELIADKAKGLSNVRPADLRRAT